MPLSRERLKNYRKLKSKKYRTLYKQCLVEGVRAILDIVAADESGKMIDAVLYTPGFIKTDMHEKLMIVVRERGGKVYEIDPDDFNGLSDTVTSQDIIAVVNQWSTSIDTIVHQSAPRLIVATDAIREPGNLGALIRTCDWFGVDALLLGKGTVDIWNPKVLRAAVGSMVHIRFVEDVDLQKELPGLRSRGFFIAGTSVRGGTAINHMIPELPVVIIFGNEADGISDGVLNTIDELITIPKYGKAESLNVGIAVGVILSAIRFASQ